MLPVSVFGHDETAVPFVFLFFVFCFFKVVSLTFTYLLTPWSRVLLEKLLVLQLIKKFPSFYGTRKFITILTSARHLSLSLANSIQSPQPLSRNQTKNWYRKSRLLPFLLMISTDITFIGPSCLGILCNYNLNWISTPWFFEGKVIA